MFCRPFCLALLTLIFLYLEQKSREVKDNGGGSDVPVKKKKTSVPPHRRYMGISMLAITEQIIDELRVKLHIPAQITHGVVVFKILDGSPADRAGVEPGNYQPLSNFLLKKMFYCFLS